MTVPYEPAQLETFLAVAQTGSFTRAATRLGIRQPTVSQHIRKLEEATGRLLVLRDTHSVSLTVDGEAMIDFARTILASYGEAERFFSASQPRGRLRLGMSDDLALTRLPQILRDFRRDNPLVEIDLTVDQSGSLHRRLENDRLDLYLGKRPVSEEGGRLVRRERLVWVGTEGTRLAPDRPLPLVVYPNPSISRLHMQNALDQVGLRHRAVCICRGVNGLIAAVSAGIGISSIARSLVPAGLTVLGPHHRLPELGQIDIVLLNNPRTAELASVRALTRTILASGAQTLSR
ncbi:LysR substrate-binding domain-containing protein [Acidothermaceae bacterium B102]|nr:LysR substrate-binding domain-containing protein [Acidothermaceae bacterium B102]